MEAGTKEEAIELARKKLPNVLTYDMDIIAIPIMKQIESFVVQDSPPPSTTNFNVYTVYFNRSYNWLKDELSWKFLHCKE